jgi:hypothetical protein
MTLRQYLKMYFSIKKITSFITLFITILLIWQKSLPASQLYGTPTTRAKKSPQADP